MAAFVVLAGFGYMVFYGTGEFGLESVFNDNNEAKPHVAFNTPLDTGAHFQKQEPEPVTPEPVAEPKGASKSDLGIFVRSMPADLIILASSRVVRP